MRNSLQVCVCGCLYIAVMLSFASFPYIRATARLFFRRLTSLRRLRTVELEERAGDIRVLYKLRG